MLADKILFVDDDPNLLAGIKRSLHRQFAVTTAENADDGCRRLSNEGPFAVVVADMQMPGTNGIQFLRRAQDQSPDTVRLMLTGNADQKTAIEAVNQGHVFSFLTKPCPNEVLSTALKNALKQYHLVIAEKELLEKTLNGVIGVLTDVLAISDSTAFAHAQRLRDEMKTVAKWFNAQQPWELEVAAVLSQIGFVAVPPAVTAKAREGALLTGAEKDMLRRVPETGAAMIERIPRLEGVAHTIRYLKKNFDGTGLPHDSVSGEAIPISARILRVLSDLLERESPNGSRYEALQNLRQTSGIYDPAVLDAVASCFDIYVEPSEERSRRSLQLSELAIGSTLAQDVLTSDGTLLVLAGTRVTDPLIEKLKNFAEVSGIREPIYVRCVKVT